MPGKGKPCHWIALGVLALAGTSLPGCLLAEAPGGRATVAQGSSQASPPTRSPAAQALDEANERMHAGMQVEKDEAADVLFVRAMIPHHQGAIDMARIELAYGHDPKLRQLAQDIIDVQEKEIALMKTWLKEHQHDAATHSTGEQPTHLH